LKKKLFLFVLIHTVLYASFGGVVVDKTTLLPLAKVVVSDSNQSVKTDENGTFYIQSDAKKLHIKAYGYKPFEIFTDTNTTVFKIKPIKIKALYLTFWGASNNSKTMKRILKIIDETKINAIVMDVKNEYGSTSFLTDFKQANGYGAHKERTNRDIQKFIRIMKEKDIYTIARIVTFKDELQASNNPKYAIKKTDGTIWRNHDNMAWVDPFDKRSHIYTINIAKEAAKVGFDEINFDYIRFPARAGLKFSKKNTQKNRIKAIQNFLSLAQKELKKYGVFISVDTYGNICWAKDDTGIGQTIPSLAKYADYLCPMLYPSGFASGSFYFKYPSKHPYEVIHRSLKHIEKVVDLKRVRPWLQYFRDYAHKKNYYKKFEINEQIRASEDANTNGWMMWSPSSRYNLKYFKSPDKDNKFLNIQKNRT